MMIARMEYAEHPVLNPARLEQMVQALGHAAGEVEISAAMEELAVQLSRVRSAWEAGDLIRLDRLALDIATAADHIGMISLCRVAADVMRLTNQSDEVALAATVARLRRLGEQSLLAIWDAQSMSI